MKELAKNYKRIVVKIGSSLFSSKDEQLNYGNLNKIVNQVADLVNGGKEVILVSSGAIALGMSILRLKERPKELYKLQVAAAVGQNEVIDQYRKFFKPKGLPVAQILLTRDDCNIKNKKRWDNVRATLLELLKIKCVPIVNENDTVSTEEIKFGDNDTLSALVASLVSADLLIILSDVDGLLDRNKKVIPVVDEINHQIKSLACPTDKHTCVGGMITKIEAASIIVNSGASCVIANGNTENIILSVIKEPERYGTLFVNKRNLTEREHWIAFRTKPKGKIIVDGGAKNAILNKKSLLSVGITALDGDFDTGDIVSITDKQGNEFARGKTMLSAKQLDKVKGTRTDKEVIHCDNIVVL